MAGRQQATAQVDLVAAAASLLAEHGVAGTRMGMVAATCGVSVGTVYNHFASKDHLIAAVMRDVEQRFVAAMEAAAPPTTSLRRALPALVDALLELATRTPTARLLAELPVAADPENGPEGALVRAWISGRVRLAQQAGQVGPAAPELVADLAYAVVAAGLRRAGRHAAGASEPELTLALIRSLDALLPRRTALPRRQHR